MLVHPRDQPGDAAFNPTADPNWAGGSGGSTAASSASLAELREKYREKKAPWARKEAPTEAKEAFKWLEQVIDGHPAGVPFFHPGRGCNVVKAASPTGAVAFQTQPGPPCDPAAWYEGGCVGPAPTADEKTANALAEARQKFEGGKASAQPAKKE